MRGIKRQRLFSIGLAATFLVVAGCQAAPQAILKVSPLGPGAQTVKQLSNTGSRVYSDGAPLHVLEDGRMRYFAIRSTLNLKVWGVKDETSGRMVVIGSEPLDADRVANQGARQWWYVDERCVTADPSDPNDPSFLNDPCWVWIPSPNDKPSSPTPSPSPTGAPDPTPTPTTTPSPSPSPTPTPTPTPTPSPTPSATPTPTPQPSASPTAIWFSSDYAFSPNGDGRKDFDVIDVHVSKTTPWTLSVDGHGVIFQGDVNRVIRWDGRVNGALLPDGKYMLRLTASGIEKTAEVIVDTQKPSFTVSIDDVDFGDKNRGGIVNNVIPKIVANLKDELSAFDGTSNVEITFSQRADGVTPQLQRDLLSFQASGGEAKVTYEVQFKDSELLFPNKNSILFEVSDRAGNIRSRAIQFTVGSDSLYSGFPAFANAFRIMATGTTTPPKNYPLPPKVQELANRGARVVPVDPKVFLRGYYDPKLVPPNYWMYLVRASATAGAVSLVFLDDVREDLKDFVIQDSLFTVETEQFGRVTLKKDTAENHLDKHPEINATIVADAINSINRDFRQFEIWRDIGSSNKFSDELLLLSKQGQHLYQLILKQQGRGQVLVTTGYGSGVFSGAHRASMANFNSLSAADQSNFRVRQWSGAASMVLEYHKGGKIAEDNLNPQFPAHLAGEIPDDGIKPYFIDASKKKAKYQSGREIIKLPPRRRI